MPGTALEKLIKANRWRIRTGRLGSDDTAGWNGAFTVPLDGELYHVIISDGMGWKHLSIRNAQKNVLPGTRSRPVRSMFRLARKSSSSRAKSSPTIATIFGEVKKLAESAT